MGITGGEIEGAASPSRATFLELFLDLVYVFAFSRLSLRLVGDFVTQRHIVVTETGETVVLLLAVWQIWVLTARMTSAADPQRLPIQLTVFLVMFGSMIIAVTLPHAFGDRGVTFAVTYVAIKMGRSLLLRFTLPGRERLVAAGGFWWAVVSAGPWIVGAAVVPQSPARGVLWTLAVLFDYAGLTFGFWTPWNGRVQLSDLRLTAEHLAERLQQFVIITLGESILVMGTTFAAMFRPSGVIPIGLSFLTSVLIWRIYFYRAGTVLAEAIAAAPRPAGFGQSEIHTHLVMVTGIFAFGAGSAIVISHPSGHLDPAWLGLVFGGPALFLAGRSRFEYEVFARVSWSRVLGVIVLGALVPAMFPLPPVAASAAATAVLAAVAVRDAVRRQRHPEEAVKPPRL